MNLKSEYYKNNKQVLHTEKPNSDKWIQNAIFVIATHYLPFLNLFQLYDTLSDILSH